MIIPSFCLLAFGIEMFLYCYFSTRITSTVSLIVNCLPYMRYWSNPSNESMTQFLSCYLWLQYESIPDAVNFSNILQCGDLKTCKAMVLLLKIVDTRPMQIETVSIVRYEMSLEMFLRVFHQLYIFLNVSFCTISPEFTKNVPSFSTIDRLSRQHIRLLCYWAQRRQLFSPTHD